MAAPPEPRTDLPIAIDTLNGMVDPKSPEELEKLGGAQGIAQAMGSSVDTGLPDNLVELQRERYGENRLPPTEFKSLFDLIIETLSDRTLIMLLIAACISLAVGMATEGVESGWKDGVAVIVAVILIVAITVINDYQKERQFRALNEKKNDRQINVVRNGRDLSISVYDLVVGDLLILATGDVIPADGVYIKGNAARCDESSATGESDAVKKGLTDDLDPFFLSGTLLLEGDARMLVTSVGENSFNGRIRLALRAPTPDTPLQTKLARLANVIGNFALIAASFIFVAQVVKYFIINRNDLNTDDAVNACVDFLVIAITIVVVAVPEGLPLAVTIALAYSMASMMKDNNLVRHLDACETMGGATTVCSDKTGTLTQNRMTVVEGQLVGVEFTENKPFEAPNGPAKDRLIEGLSINSTAFETQTDKGLEYVGSKTECALLQFISGFGVDYRSIRDNADVIETYPFSSKKKRMSTMVAGPGDNEMTLYAKGASEIVLGMCKHYVDATGSVQPMTAEVRARFERKIDTMATDALRTIGVAYETRARGDPADWTESESVQLVCLGIVGIRDPLRPEVREAVTRCQNSGVIVRMVTGDNITTAQNIAKACGIFDESQGHICVEGPNFRTMSDEEVDKIAPRLRVMARSSPTDKLKLVSALQRVGEVVAVTGDGVNDGPALKKADVGFSMGITGTEVAKEASAIVLLDDNFASIVNAIKWGRNVFDAIRKFLQFQMTVNFAAIAFLFIALMADPDGDAENSPLQPVQLLWVNLIMDTFAAISLATEPASPELLKTKPYNRSEPLMNPYMVRRAIMQVILQVTTFLLVLYLGEDIYDTHKPADHDDDEDGRYSRAHHTVVFNVFVLSQMFNQFNSRKIHRQFNVFSGLSRHKLFIGVWFFALVVQVLMVQFGGDFVKTDALSSTQWLRCIITGLLPLLWTFLFNFIPGRITESSFYLCGRLVVARTQTKRRADGSIAVEEGEEPPSSPTIPLKAADQNTSQVSYTIDLDEVVPQRSLRNGDEATPAGLWGDAIWAVLAQKQVVDMFRRHHR